MRTYARIMGIGDDRNKRIVERTIINTDFIAARRPLNKYEYNREKDVKETEEIRDVLLNLSNNNCYRNKYVLKH